MFIFRNLESSFIILILFVFAGCWEKKYDYTYETFLVNSTKDTLNVIIGVKNTNISTEYFRNLTIPPNDTLDGNENGFGGKSINEDMELMKTWFVSWHNLDTIQIFRNDTLKCIWTAPSSSKPESIHDFFNYNSWKTWIIDKPYGVMMFTIYPEDLKLNND